MEVSTLLMVNSVFLGVIALILLVLLIVLVRKERKKERETINKIKRQISED
jgi:glucose uptake protein GlcU